MNVATAIDLLKDAPSADRPCRVNPVLTQRQFKERITGLILSTQKKFGDEHVLSRLYEMRVWQVVRNQRRPRF